MAAGNNCLLLAPLAALAALAVTTASASRPDSTAPVSSPGCGLSPPGTPGSTVAKTIKVDGLSRKFLLRIPNSYDPNSPVPVVLSHHGWTESAEEDQQGSGLSDQAEAHGFIVAYLDGYDDNSHYTSPFSTWKSWNGGGTVNSTSNKEGCETWAGTSSYCYNSCKDRRTKSWKGCDKRGCDWTTCVDSTTFNIAVLDYLEAKACVDVTREYATGQSNGAIYTFHLGAKLSHRLAAIAPISGSFMNGYIQTPELPIPVIDVTGTLDTIVPINATKNSNLPISSEGWIYSLMEDIFTPWEVVNGCGGSDTKDHYPTSFDGVQKLYCWGKQCGTQKQYPVIRCAWDGGHNYYGNSGSLNGGLVWEFLSKFSNVDHLGMGRTRLLRNSGDEVPYEVVDFESELQKAEYKLTNSYDNSTTVETRMLKKANESNRSPYGNPKYGCKDDESVLTFVMLSQNHTSRNETKYGHVCAPRKSPSECTVGGYKRRFNGCPEALVPHLGTVCLALSSDTIPDPMSRHCLRTCDRNATKTSHDVEADSQCPEDAVCVPGYLRMSHIGICMFAK